MAAREIEGGPAERLGENLKFHGLRTDVIGSDWALKRPFKQVLEVFPVVSNLNSERKSDLYCD